MRFPWSYESYLEKEARIVEKLSAICFERIVGKKALNLYGKIRRFQYNLNLRSELSYKYSVIMGIFHHWYIRKVYGGQ